MHVSLLCRILDLTPNTHCLHSLLLQHPSIVSTLDAFETVDSVFIVQEYLDGGDLYDYIEHSGMAAGPESQVKLW